MVPARTGPLSPPPSPLPRGITTKGRAGQVPARPPSAPGSRLGPGGRGWRGGQEPPRLRDPTPRWSRAGVPPCRPGLGARGRAGGAHLGRSAGGRTGRQTHGRADRRTARGSGRRRPWPLRLPGRNGFRAGRDRSREKGRRRNEEACGDRFPAGDLGETHTRVPHPLEPGVREGQGRGAEAQKPCPHPAG